MLTSAAADGVANKQVYILCMVHLHTDATFNVCEVYDFTWVDWKHFYFINTGIIGGKQAQN